MNRSYLSIRRKLAMSIIGSLALASTFAARAAWPQVPPAEARHPVPLRTAPITRGTMQLKIRATGTLEPQQVVDVNAQVAGIVKSFGPDPRGATDPKFKDKSVDYNTPVEEGTVLAQIDEAAYTAAVDAEKADVQIAQAELELAKSSAELASNNWRRAEELVKTNAISAADLDTATANRRTAEASVNVAQAKLAKREVALRHAELDLERTRIVSPLKGIVIDRRVNVGQMVSAGAASPGMFLIAADLKNLQIWASVNEADIGRLRVGQTARFTVDAFPDKSFTGRVSQVRLNATAAQDVVLFTVVVDVDNTNDSLIPYLTAVVEFDAGHEANVLLVPQAALRWRQGPAAAKGSAALHPPAGIAVLVGRGQAPSRQQLWVKDGQSIRPVEVRVGPSDGQLTEIIGGDVKEGMEVVVGGETGGPDGGQ